MPVVTRFDEAFDYPELTKMNASDFLRIYKSFMYSVAAQERMDDSQALEAVNKVLATIFVDNRCHFNPKRSRFSNYLATMVRNACRSLKRRQYKYDGFEDEDELIRTCEKHGWVTEEEEFEEEDMRRWLEEGLRILKKEVRSKNMFDAFFMRFVDNVRTQDVAAKLRVLPDYVSLAVHRCLPRLRQIVKSLMAKER